MSKVESNLLRIPVLGSVGLGWLARRGIVRGDGGHLHWDRRNRRWVAHEDAQLSGSPTKNGRAVRSPRSR